MPRSAAMSVPHAPAHARLAFAIQQRLAERALGQRAHLGILQRRRLLAAHDEHVVGVAKLQGADDLARRCAQHGGLRVRIARLKQHVLPIEAAVDVGGKLAEREAVLPAAQHGLARHRLL